MSIFVSILDLLFPPKCIFCGKFLKKGSDCLCPACSETLPFTKGANVSQKGEFYDVCVSPLLYEGDVRKSILRFKFKGAVAYADCYGRLLGDCIKENLAGKFNLITWVPLSVKRAKDRGYDQAMLLALAAALTLDDVAVETLVKSTHVQAQSSITGKDLRRANVSGVYELKDRELIAGKHILLIDDIVTTGSTLSECARTLLMGGAESVVCATLARA
ncbi:comF family protein [Sporobacter termitidis DSM 10068]|uniref:ComF family protein n=1 Tax=Sporobacter termitidis DSM 10068 TaxID=1123282 RepID=A0A1M5VM30_9FIRM|nr:phosphoribosyltransferase family protein [Sporobacter termitidis]SHH76295.1 comF family protein [Sporobacter termitidis DSM 10068]